MRIAIIMHGFPPEYMAGSEVYSLHFAKELNKKHDVIIFHRIENPYDKEYEVIKTNFEGLLKYEINIPYLPHYFEGRYINSKVEEKFIEFLDEVKPDIIHFGHLNYLSTNLVKISKERNYPIVFTLHDFWLYCPRGQLISRRDETLCDEIDIEKCVKCLEEYLYKENKPETQVRRRLDYIQKEVIKKVDLFISPSKFLLNKMVQLGIPEEKITYLDYGFNYNYFKNFKKKKSEKIRFGYIGRIIPVKGVHLIIDAFNKITNPEIELYIYGSSSNVDYLKSRTKNPNIHFPGEYNNWEIGEVLSEIDVVIVPSIWFENSPLVIHEAAIAKIPVITTNLGGMAEYVQDEVNGLLFKRNNVDDLLEKIMRFVNEPDLIEKYGNNHFQVQLVEEHTNYVEKLYQSLLEE